jgi:hypothetical protein
MHRSEIEGAVISLAVTQPGTSFLKKAVTFGADWEDYM